ncbi:MAG: hypothetical protein HXX20_11810 [Chloroflexi bacterium]|nr:hypothetical protein [Chloroflexota bacterium]
MNKQSVRLHVLENQINRLEKRLTRLSATSNRYSWTRLGLFLVEVGLTIAAFYFGGSWIGSLGIVVSLVVFNVVAYYHRRVDQSITRHKIWLKLKTTQVARLKLDWIALPAMPILAPSKSDHPFETDLDLTGERSLHRLIDTALTQEGSQRLKDWLLDIHPNLPLIQHRQILVQELAPLTLFRDKLRLNATLASGQVAEQWEGKKLLDWLSKHIPNKSLLQTLRLLSGLALVDIVLFLLSFSGIFPNYFWLLSFVVYVGVFQVQASSTAALLEEAYTLRDGLIRLRAVLKYLETYHYGRHSNLKKLCEPFLDRTKRPSAQLKRISRVADGAILQKNAPLWIVINAIVPLRFYLAHRLNFCKAQVATLLPGWLEVWFELEALNSLAEFSYLNPDYIFPEVVPDDKPLVFQAAALGHPLILQEQKICNDFTLNQSGEIVIITGSNMAGKSSFLRTLGTNLCLTYAGGPVNAGSFQTSLFRLFTCIKVSDSVTDGFSYFYAEVKRLKALLDELERPDPLPLFFLIDEIFRGTNNRERLIGSRSYLRALVGRNGVGIVSTHDLELVKLAEEIPRIQNFHFKETVLEGRMVFDYKLRPGPCPTTNALKIMRLEGLPVDTPD